MPQGVPSLNIGVYGGAADDRALLEQAYESLVTNYQRQAISTAFRNQNLSGDLNSGSVKAARYTNSVDQTYGTARAAQRGAQLVERPVLVTIRERREIVEEFDRFDQRTAPAYLQEVISGRNTDHANTITRRTETDFFTVTHSCGSGVFKRLHLQ